MLFPGYTIRAFCKQMNTCHTFNSLNALFLLQILPGLYVGNLRDSKDSRQLDIHKITHILSIHDDDARKPFKVRYLILEITLNHLLYMVAP